MPGHDHAVSGRGPSLATIAPGDLVTVRGETRVHEGEILLREGGDSWQELHLAGTPERYLGVVWDPEPELTLWTTADLPGVVPGARDLELGGRRYRRREQGSAGFRATGIPGLPAHGICEYVDYAAADGALLSFERFPGGGWEASTGERLHPSEVRVERGERRW